MTAIDTRQFMALMTIAQHHGRPRTPTDQAHIESFFSHLKGDWPHLVTITDPAALDSEFARVRTDYNTIRLHPSIGSSPLMASITAAAPRSVARVPPGCAAPGPSGSSTIEPARHDDPPEHRPRPPPSGEQGRF
jgi:transposase InsO family protein